MAWQKIQIVCPKCDGKKTTMERTGFVEDFYATSTCSMCNGKGFVEWGRLKVELDPTGATA